MAADVIPIRKSNKIQCTGVGRDAEHSKCLIAYFDRQPTDDQMRFFHDCLKRWGAIAPGST